MMHKGYKCSSSSHSPTTWTAHTEGLVQLEFHRNAPQYQQFWVVAAAADRPQPSAHYFSASRRKTSKKTKTTNTA